jgi:Family of unknown function (DUF6318)
MLLAGCGGDSTAGTSPPSTTTSSPTTHSSRPKTTSSAPTTSSASPTSGADPAPKTDPSIPAAARAHTPAGAEAFVRYFIERLNVAWTVPRAGILSPLCQASSKACAAFERDAARLTAEGHRYDGDPVTVEFIGALDYPGPNKLDVLANVVQERRSEIDAAGRTYVTDKRKILRFNFELLYTAQTWSVSSIRKIMK